MSKKFLQNGSLTVATIALFLLTESVDKLFHVNLVFLPGIFLLFWLPGKICLDFFPPLRNKFGFIGNLAFDVFLSFSLIITLQLAIPQFGYQRFTNGILFLDLILAAISLLAHFAIQKNLIKPATVFYSKGWECPKPTKRDILILLIPLMVLFIIYYLDPVARDNDGFLSAVKAYVSTGEITKIRGEFMRSIGSISLFLRLSYLMVFRLLFVLMFYISTFFAFDFLGERFKDKTLKYLAYLSIIAVPVILSEINIVRPQAVVIAYTLPILFLIVKGLERRNFYLLLIASWFSVCSMAFHDLGITLLLISSLGLLYYIIREIVLYKKKYLIKDILLLIALTYPYIAFRNYGDYFGQINHILDQMRDIILSLNHINWWFIDSYTSIDGKELGWPGIMSLFYYLYNGILFIFAGTLTFFLFKRHLKNKSKLIAPFLYFLIYFAAAEILPRFGFYFLLNRAWVHLMLGFYALFISFIADIEITQKWRKLVYIAFCLIIVVGFLGTIYVTKNNISDFSKEELSISKYIKDNTPANSMVISSQENDAIVSIYGERKFSRLIFTPDDDLAAIRGKIDKEVSIVSTPSVKYTPEVKKVVTVITDGVVTETKEKEITPAKEEIIPAILQDNAPIYFVYSFSKLKGMNASRSYLTENIDIAHKDLYDSSGYTVIKKTDIFILLKVK